MNTCIRFPAHIASLRPYVAGKPISDLARRLQLPEAGIAKLASNENPFGPSPKALQALSAAAIDVSRYPDNDCVELTHAIARFHDVPPEWIVVGAGSESVLSNATAMALEVGKRTAYAQYSFQAYVAAAQRVGATHMVVPSPDFRVDLDGLRGTLKDDPSLVYIANPGNPTGTCLDPDELQTFLRLVPPHVLVVLDEAYYEFVAADKRPPSLEWVRQFPNLVVTRTFSKAYGLAGLRVGYGITQPAVADMLRRIRPPFTVTHQAQVAAAAAMDDIEFLRDTVKRNAAYRSAMASGLAALGFSIVDSETNFLLVRAGDGADLTARLERHGLMVRPVVSYGLPDWIRISIGTAEQNTRLLQAIALEQGS